MCIYVDSKPSLWRCLGRITSWKQSVSITCYLHKNCSKAKSIKSLPFGCEFLMVRYLQAGLQFESKDDGKQHMELCLAPYIRFKCWLISIFFSLCVCKKKQLKCLIIQVWFNCDWQLQRWSKRIYLMDDVAALLRLLGTIICLALFAQSTLAHRGICVCPTTSSQEGKNNIIVLTILSTGRQCLHMPCVCFDLYILLNC